MAPSSDGPVSLESALSAQELRQRPSRPPDHETETHALSALAQALSESPRHFLQAMAEQLLEHFRCGSAGFSLLTTAAGDERFTWAAGAGVWKPHLRGTMPRDFGPCRDVLDRAAPLLFRRFEGRDAETLPRPPAGECLLAPFYVGRKAAGIIWLIAHDEHRRFDAEDLRLLERLARFGGAAFQVVDLLAASEAREYAVRRSHAELELAARALRDADRRKDVFIATFAHELRQPVAAMLPALTLMSDGAPESSRSHAREVLERQLVHLRRMTDDLLDLARVAEGKLDIQKERVDARQVVQDVRQATCRLFEWHRHSLTVSVPDEPVWLEGDPTRLQQVLANLLTNAAKYTDDGGQISLKLQISGDAATIRILDNGQGIAPDALPHVFDLFVQEARDHPVGLGIGLKVVRGLVEMHGGQVTVRSDGVGKGSEFVVTLPLAPPPPSS